MAWRFNETVHLTLTREEADAVHRALLFVTEEQEGSDEADKLQPVVNEMMRQTERRTYSIIAPPSR